MRWIFLSPHLDDVVLSCGGLIYELIQENQDVHVWTVCAGDSPTGPLSPLAQALHLRWQTGDGAPAARRKEDILACRVLCASPLHFDIPECIYRHLPGSDMPVIGSNDELFQPLPDFEKPLAAQVAAKLKLKLAPDDRIVSPLAIGGHVDHYLVRDAAESLARDLLYYPDFPYIDSANFNQSDALHPAWQTFQRIISDKGLADWQLAVLAYTSQISTFWGSADEMKCALRLYRDRGGGGTLRAVQPKS